MTQSEETSASEPQTRKRRARLIVAGIALLLLAVLALTPPYVNVNRYRRRITTTMSQSLGRPVHLDNVTLHLLPVPQLTLSNLVVSEGAAFGSEPVIRANTVEATMRVSSLWRRQVEFSTIRFIDPSVNLVRNAQGRWNLEDVLMQASHVETAPTAQRKAGPAPRFPYIEATGARVNVKIGDEKKPFSLTDAQFALWLPSPQLWRVRMRGRPTRTDSNVSQTGEITLEASLQRAPKMSDVQLDLHLNWNDAPLGEASRLLTGNDAGWRGTGFVQGHVSGQLSHASVTTHLQLNDLRRADFVPAQSLDITVDCSSSADVAKATLSDVKCVLPVGEATPITLSATAVDLENSDKAPATVSAKALPLPWLFGWAKLFVPEIPATLEPSGEVHGELAWNNTAASWRGSFTAELPPNIPITGEAPKAAETTQFTIAIDSAPGGVSQPIARLAPVVLHPAAEAAFTLSGEADANAYTLQLTGTGTNSQVLTLASMLPPLNEGVASSLQSSEKESASHAIALICSRVWGGVQSCSQAAAAPALKAPHTRVKRRR